MSERRSSSKKRIIQVVEDLLGETVRSIDTPGGSARASCRVILKDRTIIATKRPNFRRTHLEAAVLKALSARTRHVPTFLGLQDDVLLQSDVGGRRLSQLAWTADKEGQRVLARDALASILEIQSAARIALADVPVPPLGQSRDWVAAMVGATRNLEEHDRERVPMLNHDAAIDALRAAPVQFLKWDCRSGNAARDMRGRLCWFDFEYCGMRHGAEDIAWLIGDESWPVPATEMFTLLESMLPDHDVGDVDDYLSYLGLYTTFHILQRLDLIQRETEKRGYRSRAKIIERDDVGRHPDFAAALCRNGMACAELHPLTAPLRRGFKRAAARYAAEAEKLARAGRRRSA
ncbi:hypothetical protein [Pseudaestuariivita atlantica]|uniref:Aminoglycoside phosphotransferase domain-containing protein n=1 Tax=Pseudaestuariivita atlantica TaxID=1317121 RepID=A0A0L1JKN5_9RHOB|nr:hypothetical protein [Pseudaestuariivita atlantica]KNG92315.1 hypothetical protein ATO11_18330 [Pseudaestuariivita atlantica]